MKDILIVIPVFIMLIAIILGVNGFTDFLSISLQEQLSIILIGLLTGYLILGAGALFFYKMYQKNGEQVKKGE
jgi:NhaP-type Na+/H+ or K+/H+ antiporter